MSESDSNPETEQPFELEIIDVGESGNFRSSITLETTEITALCPINKLPDWGTLKLTYNPNARIVELKSFKMWMNSFRNTPIFQENLAQTILDRLVEELDPKCIELELVYNIRGGVGTTVNLEYWRENNEVEPLTQEELLTTYQRAAVLVAGSGHATPVYFVYDKVEDQILIITDKNSRKMDELFLRSKLIIHDEPAGYLNWQSTACVIASATMTMKGDKVEEQHREMFRAKYPWFTALEEVDKDKQEDDVLIIMSRPKFTYFDGTGITNKGGQ